MTRKYLITGGAGFIGSHLCDALASLDNDVVVLDNFASGKLENLVSGRPRVRVIDGDIRSINNHSEEVGAIDTIIHLAALISGRDSLYQPDAYFDVNVTGTLRLIEFAVEHAVPRILFASSSTVYGDSPSDTVDEQQLPMPVTVYALSKLAGEHLLALYGRMHDFTHASLRLFNVYGPRQGLDHPYANVACKFSHAAATGGTVRRYGDGEQTRDFIYITDVVDAFLTLAESSRDTIYNVGTGTDHSINTLLASLEDTSGHTIPIEHHVDWPNDVRRIRADTSRMEREFGYRPHVDIRQGLASTVDFFTSNPKAL